MSVWQRVDSGTGYALYQISQTPLGVVSLEWSPDGQNLWLNVATGPQGHGFVPTTSLVVNRDTHQGWSAALYGDTFCSTTHSWSPDGQQLAYVRDGWVWLVDAQGQEPGTQSPHFLAEGFYFPQYSPDGTMLAAIGRHKEGNSIRADIWIWDVAAGTQERIIENVGGGPPVWSPSGKALALLGEAHVPGGFSTGAARLWIADIASGRTLFVDVGPLPGAEGCLKPPVWLMDGQKVLVTLLLSPGVWVIDLDGNMERLDERHLRGQTGRPPGLAAPHRGGFCDGAVASPDGRYVVYSAATYRIYVIDLHTGRDVGVGTGDLCHSYSQFTWAPTGPWFLRWTTAEFPGGGGYPVDLVDASDGTRRQLLDSGLWPSWSPDGQHVAYWQPESEGYALWLLSLDDQSSERLTSAHPDDPHGRWLRAPYSYNMAPHWSPDGAAIAFVSSRRGHPEAYVLQLTD